MEKVKLHYLCVLLTVSVVVAGCGGSGTTSVSGGSGSETQGQAIEGTVYGGQQPISGAKVYLYAAGKGGYASPATSLLTGAGYVTTGSDGSFSITGDYTCPSAPGDLVYVTSVGGNPGNSGGRTNPNIVLIAALGPCGNLSSSTFVFVNEITTVASTYALAPFMGYTGNNPAAGTPVNLGAPTSGVSCNAANNWLSTGANTCDYVGLKNAFSMVNNLAVTSTGVSLEGTSTLVTPYVKVNTLADILTACVNSTGGTAGDGSNCGTLFTATTPGSTGIAPTDTLQATLDLARNPGPTAANSTSLFNLTSSTVTYQPALLSVPKDWTLSITLSGGGLDGPTSIGIDATGNVWAADYYGALSAFSPAGVALFSSGITGDGLHESWGLTLDGSGDVWVTNIEVAGINNNLGSISEFANNGQPLSGSLGYGAGGIYYPQALAADTDGSIWVANYGNSTVTHLSSSGAPASGDCNGSTCGLTSASIEFPDAIAVDPNHNVWVASETTSTITKISGNGTQFTAINCCNEAQGLAIDASGNVWSANHSGSTVSLVSNTGTVISAGYTGGGLNDPNGIAVDGNGTVWVTNYRGGSFTELAGAGSANHGTALSPSTGYGADVNLVEPFGIAIDASGNVWISNFDSVPAQGQQGTITEFVGLATPVNTPLVGAARIP